MSSVATAEREQFSRLFEAYYAQVHAFAARRVGRDLADEVSAETFLVAWRRLEQVPPEPLPWLYGVARNIVLRQLQASARREQTQALLLRERPLPLAPADGEPVDRRAWTILIQVTLLVLMAPRESGQ